METQLLGFLAKYNESKQNIIPDFRFLLQIFALKNKDKFMKIRDFSCTAIEQEVRYTVAQNVRKETIVYEIE